MSYRGTGYELRSATGAIAIGHLTQRRALAVGDRIDIAGSAAVVRAVESIVGDDEPHVIVQLAVPVEGGDR